MKPRALIALLLLFLWTLVPGIGAACGGTEARPDCPVAENCDCCADDAPCLCAAPAPAKSERPLATSQPELKLPLVLPSEPLWDAALIASPIAPAAALTPVAPVAAAPDDMQARFCTFLL